MQLLVLSLRGLVREIAAGHVTQQDLDGAMAYFPVPRLIGGALLLGVQRHLADTTLARNERELNTWTRMVSWWIVENEHRRKICWAPCTAHSDMDSRNWDTLDSLLRANGYPSVRRYLPRSTICDPSVTLVGFDMTSALALVAKLNPRPVVLVPDDVQFSTFGVRHSLREEWIAQKQHAPLAANA